MYVSFHQVGRINVSARSAVLSAAGDRHHWQTLELFDRKGRLCGSVTLFLAHPDAALPLGDRSALDRPGSDHEGDPF